MELRIKSPTLLNVLRFTARVNAIVAAREAEDAPPVEAPPAETTFAAVLADAPAALDAAVRARTRRLYEALIDEHEALALAPLVAEHADGRPLTAAEAEAMPSAQFWEAWTLFLTHSGQATSAALGFAPATASPSPPTPTPTSPSSSS